MSISVQWHRLPVSGPQSSNVWVWQLSQQVAEGEKDFSDGWEQIDPTNLQTPFLALISQLADTFTILTPGSVTLTTWAKMEDIEHVRSYPIILAFQTPGEQPLSSSPFPPPHIGELGLILEGEVLHLYMLETLGQEGQATCQRLQTALERLQTSKLDMRRQEGIWQVAQQTAQELAKLYWQAHHASTRTPARKVPPTPYIVGSNVLIVASLPVQAALAAFSNAQSGAQSWKEVRKLPTFTYDKEDGTTHVQMRPFGANVTLDESAMEALWQQVSQLSDLDGDVLLAMLAQTIATEADERGGTWIKGGQILDYRGIKPKTHAKDDGRKRRAGHRQEDLMDIAACIDHMSNTYLTVRQWIGEDETGGRKRKAARKRLFSHESRLLLVMDTIYQYELNFTTGTPRASKNVERPPLAIAWRYQFGSWIDPFLKEPNRQIAWLLQQALSYDPYHEMWEKRLARYFTFHMRMNAAGGGTTIERQIGALIEELSLPIDRRNPEKTRQRLERALDRLLKDRQIDDWKYSGDVSQLPSRRWLETWLTYSIRVASASIVALGQPDT